MTDDLIGSCDCCGEAPVKITFSIAYGIETYACSKCRGREDEE